MSRIECRACGDTGWRWDGFSGTEPCDCGADLVADERARIVAKIESDRYGLDNAIDGGYLLQWLTEGEFKATEPETRDTGKTT